MEEEYLICVATIDSRKNSVLLAEAAHIAQVPVLFLGKPYSRSDPYFQRFQELIDNRYVKYAGFVSTEEKFRLLRGARGFALLSKFESGCIAAFEASAAGLPMLLSDLPWGRKSYIGAKEISYAPLANAHEAARVLKRFYDTAHRRPGRTFPILTWHEVAQRYASVYAEVSARRSDKHLVHPLTSR